MLHRPPATTLVYVVVRTSGQSQADIDGVSKAGSLGPFVASTTNTTTTTTTSPPNTTTGPAAKAALPAATAGPLHLCYYPYHDYNSVGLDLQKLADALSRKRKALLQPFIFSPFPQKSYSRIVYGCPPCTLTRRTSVNHDLLTIITH